MSYLNMSMFMFRSIFSHGSSEDDENQRGMEYSKYFKNIFDAFINMLVLLTTANNPDGTLYSTMFCH